MRKRTLDFLVPFIVAAVFIPLNFIPFYRSAEQSVYDLFLQIKPGVEQRPDILLLDIDDTAIAEVGVWPWSREYAALGLIRLAEFDTGAVVFDIEYVNRSPQSVDSDFLRNQLPQELNAELSNVQSQVQQLVAALQSGAWPLSEADDLVEQFGPVINTIERDLVGTVSSVVQDNDAFLGNAAAFHGNAYFTVNILSYEELVPFDRDAAAAQLAISNINVESDLPVREGVDIRPTIPAVLRGARGAGFPNIVVDEDGVRRRVDLVAEVNGNYYAQLVFDPLLDWIGDPEVEVLADSVILRGAVMPGQDEPQDVRIPVTSEGHMLVHWPKALYLESFRHMTYYRLVLDWELEEEIVELWSTLESATGQFFADSSVMRQAYEYAAALERDLLQNPRTEDRAEWRATRAFFFETLDRYVNGDALDRFLEEINIVIEAGGTERLSPEDLRVLAEDSQRLFESLRTRHELFEENREVLQAELPGSFVIIGHVGTSTTDIGVTPFEEEYMNVGTHAAVLNTILQQDFLDDLPWWYSIVALLAFAIVTALLIRDTRPTPSILIGVGMVLLISGGGLALFLTTGTYLNMLTPIGGVLLTFITLTAIKFIRENQEKTYIRNAFGHYLSTDVINQVIDDPTKLRLGGEKVHMTAMFTDVKGFSTISEKLRDEPEKLVQLLNRYLTEMSDIILDERGTIDKYEGDAIISFFGAPVGFEDAAVRACRSAVEMKKVEALLNTDKVGGLAPAPLFTRIGVNTGEMVVGNMGTEKRMDYTMMGHNVNLAARLEGVNKLYGTWILISEQTYEETYSREKGIKNFTVRKLDRVRVVGVTEPIRLYELVDHRDVVDRDQKVIHKLRTFNSGLTKFEEKDWEGALKLFREVLDEFPEDGPSKLYLKRCQDFMKKPPRPDWDGVYNMESK
ncbi:MAG: CHASE2 domain-containing protein [Spirochaetota bacterium]